MNGSPDGRPDTTGQEIAGPLPMAAGRHAIPGSAAPATMRITAVEVLDTETGEFKPRRDLVLAGGRIADGGGGASTRDDGDAIDGSRLTAVPGFVDAHFHCAYAGHLGIGQLEDASLVDGRMARATANLTTALDHGITSVFDMGSHGRIAVTLRDAVRAGSVEGPRMRVCGQIIIKAGGPMDVPQRSRPQDRLFRVVRDRRDLAAAIVDQAEWGVDAIKMQISASAVQSDDPPRESTFSASELRSAVTLAHELGLLVCTHAEGDGPTREALRAGVDVLQHASFASRDTLREIRDQGAGLVFTPGVYRAIARRGQTVGYPADGVRRVHRQWAAMVQTIQMAAESGMTFGVGSDAGGAVHPHGEYLEDVVSLVEDCHLPVGLALSAATRGSAVAARIDEAGSLRPGMPADLLLVDSETVRLDLGALSRSSNLTVIQGGRVRSLANARQARNP